MTGARYLIRQVPSGKWTTVRDQWPDGSKCQVPDTVTSIMTDSPDGQIRQLDGRFGDGLLPMGAVAIKKASTGYTYDIPDTQHFLQRKRASR